jgi:hypothetical protein
MVLAFDFAKGAAKGAAAGEEVETKRTEVCASMVDTIDAEIEAFEMLAVAEY